jgi:hypothetical protein
MQIEIFNNFTSQIASNSGNKYKRVPIGPICPSRSLTTYSFVGAGRSHKGSITFAVRITSNPNNKLLKFRILILRLFFLKKKNSIPFFLNSFFFSFHINRTY